MTEDIAREIEAIRAQAALCPPGRSLLDSIRHHELMRKLGALREKAFRQQAGPLVFKERAYSRRRGRYGRRRSGGGGSKGYGSLELDRAPRPVSVVLGFGEGVSAGFESEPDSENAGKSPTGV